MMIKSNLKISKMKILKILNHMNLSEFHSNVKIVVFSLQTVFLLHITLTFIVNLSTKLSIFHGGSLLLPLLESRSLWLTQELRLLWLTLTVQSDPKITKVFCSFQIVLFTRRQWEFIIFCNKFMAIITYIGVLSILG